MAASESVSEGDWRVVEVADVVGQQASGTDRPLRGRRRFRSLTFVLLFVLPETLHSCPVFSLPVVCFCGCVSSSPWQTNVHTRIYTVGCPPRVCVCVHCVCACVRVCVCVLCMLHVPFWYHMVLCILSKLCVFNQSCVPAEQLAHLLRPLPPAQREQARVLPRRAAEDQQSRWVGGWALLCVVWCGVMPCGVACCSVVCGVVWRGVMWYDVWRSVVWCRVMWCDVVWSDVVRCGVVWSGVLWYAVALLCFVHRVDLLTPHLSSDESSPACMLYCATGLTVLKSFFTFLLLLLSRVRDRVCCVVCRTDGQAQPACWTLLGATSTPTTPTTARPATAVGWCLRLQPCSRAASTVERSESGSWRGGAHVVVVVVVVVVVGCRRRRRSVVVVVVVVAVVAVVGTATTVSHPLRHSSWLVAAAT